MNEFKGTPAPWRAVNQDIRAGKSDDDDDVVYVAIAWGGSTKGEGDFDVAVADARLIAAAPDLLASLQKVMTWIRNWSPDFTEDDEWDEDETRVLAAIAKALGQDGAS